MPKSKEKTDVTMGTLVLRLGSCSAWVMNDDALMLLNLIVLYLGTSVRGSQETDTKQNKIKCC